MDIYATDGIPARCLDVFFSMWAHVFRFISSHKKHFKKKHVLLLIDVICWVFLLSRTFRCPINFRRFFALGVPQCHLSMTILSPCPTLFIGYLQFCYAYPHGNAFHCLCQEETLLWLSCVESFGYTSEFLLLGRYTHDAARWVWSGDLSVFSPRI